MSTQPEDPEDGKEADDLNSKLEHRGSTFDGLLALLQMEHKRELEKVRCELREEVTSVQNELQEARSLLDKIQLQSTDISIMKARSLKGDQIEDCQQINDSGSGVERHISPSSPSAEPTSDAVKSKTLVRGLSRVKHWADDHQTSSLEALLITRRQRMRTLVSSQCFEFMCIFAVVSNGAVISFELDYVARNESDPDATPKIYRTIAALHSAWFILELVLKMYALGVSFCCGPDRLWNAFDVIVIGTDVSHSIMDITRIQSDTNMNTFTFLRMLRMLRVTRVLRVIRFVRFFRELRIMVASMMKSITSLLWSLLLLILIIYMFAFFLLSAVVFFVFEHKDHVHYSNYRNYWSSLPVAMWTLYSCMTGGVSWMEVGDPLIDIGWGYGFALGLFLFLTLFVVTNIITGIFVDSSIQQAENDRDELIQQDLDCRNRAMVNLKYIFERLDDDHSGTLTLTELESQLQNEDVEALLDSLGLQVEQARALFLMLDIRNSQEISIEEFIFGCMKLKGPAKSIDLATMQFEQNRQSQEHMRLLAQVLNDLSFVHEKLDAAQQKHDAVMLPLSVL